MYQLANCCCVSCVAAGRKSCTYLYLSHIPHSPCRRIPQHFFGILPSPSWSDSWSVSHTSCSFLIDESRQVSCFCIPFLVGEHVLSESTSQLSPYIQSSNPTRKQERSDELDAYELSVGGRTECILITRKFHTPKMCDHSCLGQARA